MAVWMSLLIFVGLVSCSSMAHEYRVGGKHGWGLRPSQKYSRWASKTRFQVDDSLVFRYKNGTDSVLVVTPGDYCTCNKSSPIRTLQNDGEKSKFNLEHSGYFYFISGKADNCEKGEKIIILVMAPRDQGHNSPSPTPATFSPSPAPTPSVTALNFPPSPSPSPAETAPAPAPVSGASELINVMVSLFGAAFVFLY